MEATTYAPGKGEWRRALITQTVNSTTPSIFYTGDRGRLYFCCSVHRLYPFRQFPPRKLIQPIDALEVCGKSGANPPLPSQL